VALVVLVGALQMRRADAGLVTMAATFQPKRIRSRHSLLYREEHGAAGRHHNVFMPIAIAKVLSWEAPPRFLSSAPCTSMGRPRPTAHYFHTAPADGCRTSATWKANVMSTRRARSERP
jgi:hypothetical protein